MAREGQGYPCYQHDMMMMMMMMMIYIYLVFSSIYFLKCNRPNNSIPFIIKFSCCQMLYLKIRSKFLKGEVFMEYGLSCGEYLRGVMVKALCAESQ